MGLLISIAVVIVIEQFTGNKKKKMSMSLKNVYTTLDDKFVTCNR